MKHFVLLLLFCVAAQAIHNVTKSRKEMRLFARSLHNSLMVKKIRIQVQFAALRRGMKVDMVLRHQTEAATDVLDEQDQSGSFVQGYDEKQSMNIWRLAQITYCGIESIQKWACSTVDSSLCVLNQYDGQIDQSSIKVFNNKDEFFSRAFIAFDKKTKMVGVAFRGTIPSSGKNWATNVNAFQTVPRDQYDACSGDDETYKRVKRLNSLTYPKYDPTEYNDKSSLLENCGVHSGFQKISNDLSQNQGMEQAIKDLLLKQAKAGTPTPIQIVVTGHSLGAAQAILYSLRLLKLCDVWTTNNKQLTTNQKNRLCKLHDVYSFCAPRVGNEAFTELYNSMFEAAGVNHFRVVNGQDIVPQAPFLWNGYRHTGKLVYYQRYVQGEAKSPNGNFAQAKFCNYTPYTLSATTVNPLRTIDYIHEPEHNRGSGDFDRHCFYDIGVTSGSIADHSDIFHTGEKCDNLESKKKIKLSYRKKFGVKKHKYSHHSSNHIRRH